MRTYIVVASCLALVLWAGLDMDVQVLGLLLLAYPFVLYCLAPLASWVGACSPYQRRFGRAYRLLHDDLEPAEAIPLFSELLERRGLGAKNRYYCRLNLAAALEANGDADSALAILRATPVAHNDPKRFFPLHYCLAGILYRHGDTDGFRAEYALLAPLLDKPAISHRYAGAIDNLHMRMTAVDGDVAAALDLSRAARADAHFNRLDACLDYYELAGLCEKTGDRERWRAAMRHVADNGGNTHFAHVARGRLLTMPDAHG